MEGNGSGPDRTAFVLTGGGSLGAVQVGMLYALLSATRVPAQCLELERKESSDDQ
jgi:predicted acylesterase/phospholipase RssA